jgi:trans-2,3-dihydro-3-hydroxyanthranilate isomerase
MIGPLPFRRVQVGSYSYRLLNVFAESTFGGNPLCVFEHADTLSYQQMQAIALQFNLSETVFLMSSRCASARLRIFTPDGELPFGGHPVLGAAQVVRDLLQSGDSLSLECQTAVIAVSAQADLWTFTAASHGLPVALPCALSRAEIASVLGLLEQDLLSDAVWVNTGSEQLLVPLCSSDAVRRARIDSAQLHLWPKNNLGRQSVYLFAFDRTSDANVIAQVNARYFFAGHAGGVLEDPATGSACANLGAWCLANGSPTPINLRIHQGEQVQRESYLYLHVDVDRKIEVSGRVIELGRGVIHL